MANPVLRKGSRGSAVRNLQVTLNSFAQQFSRPDFNTGSPDGVFGSGTTQAVKSFQYATSKAADGIVGSGTWKAINDVTQAILRGKSVNFKSPAGSPQMAPTGQTRTAAPTPLSIPGGFDLDSLVSGVDWKVVGIAVAVGVGLLYTMKGRK